MPPTHELFTIPREEAAARVGVSTRTLDRWLKSGRLRSRTVGRNIFVSDKDLAALAKTAAPPAPSKPAKKPATVREREPVAEAAPVFTGTAEPPPARETANVENVRVAATEEVYKKLYEEAAGELKQKQEKLEAAGFRVGQLEAQLKNSVPVLALKQAEETLQRENGELRVRLSRVELRGWLFLAAAVLAGGAAAVLAFF